MQLDRCCWGWWRIRSQQHHSVFPPLHHSYSQQMQQDQLSRDFPICPPSSFSSGIRISFTSPPHFPRATATHFLRVQFSSAFAAGSLERARWWALQTKLLDVATFDTQSWHCSTAFLSTSMVVRPCYEKQLNSGGRLWSCDSSSGLGTSFLHSFGWICQLHCASVLWVE